MAQKDSAERIAAEVIRLIPKKIKKNTYSIRPKPILNLENGFYKIYYFLGIGGMGMSALARYFNSKDFRPPAMTAFSQKLLPTCRRKEFKSISTRMWIKFPFRSDIPKTRWWWLLLPFLMICHNLSISERTDLPSKKELKCLVTLPVRHQQSALPGHTEKQQLPL